MEPTARRRTLRLAWLRLHKLLALGAGLILLLLAITGSVLVWQPELDRWWAPSHWEVAEKENQQLDQTVADLNNHAASAYPGRKVEWVWFPYGRQTAVGFLSVALGESRSRAPEIWMDRTSGILRGARVWRETPIGFLFYLHAELLGGETGRTMVGWFGLALAGSLTSGLVLWWPTRGQRVLRDNVNTSRIRRLFDVHRTIGIVSFPVILALAVTGIFMTWPELSKNMLATVLTVAPEIDPKALPSESRISYQAGLEKAQAVFPKAIFTDFMPPKDEKSALWFGFLQPREPGDYAGQSAVWVCPNTGEVLAVKDALKTPLGTRTLDWAAPIHFGTAFGLLGRLIVFGSGLCLSGLVMSGFFLLWSKRRVHAAFLERKPPFQRIL